MKKPSATVVISTLRVNLFHGNKIVQKLIWIKQNHVKIVLEKVQKW